MATNTKTQTDKQNADKDPLPSNLTAEIELLGAMINNNQLIPRLADEITEDEFFDPLHQSIYKTAQQMVEAGRIVTPTTLKTFLGDPEITNGVTLMQYLARLVADACNVNDAVAYAKELRSISNRRKAFGIATEMAQWALHAPPGEKFEVGAARFEDQMGELRTRMAEQSDFKSFDNIAARSIDQIAKAYQNDGRITGMSTGLKDLDEAIGGLHPGDFVIVAGRPGMGKTAFLQRLMITAGLHLQAAKEGAIAGLFSMEMTDVQIAIRILCERANVYSSKVRRNTIDVDDFERIADVARDMRKFPLYIDQSGRMSIHQLTTKARQLHRHHPLAILAVDYVQLMGAGGWRRKEENRTQELTDITGGLKALGKELGCPVVAAAQLSRQVEQRDDKRPMLSDLRESGSIEQDADTVLFLYRDEYYASKRKPPEGTEEFFEWEARMNTIHGRAEVIVAKNRHGGTAVVDVGFDAKLMRFTDALTEAPVEPDTGKKKARKPKGPSFSKEANLLWGAIKSMTHSLRYFNPSPRPHVEHKEARWLKKDELMKVWAEDIGQPGDDVSAKFKKCFVELRNAEYAFAKETDQGVGIYGRPDLLF